MPVTWEEDSRFLTSVRLTMICSGATRATRHGAFPLDEPLEPRSIAMAESMRQGLRRADRTWTSPALRARQTAGALALPATVQPLLADHDHGDWAGRTFADVQAEESDALAVWLADPNAAPHGGEPLSGLLLRAATFMNELVQLPGHTIAVTHAAMIRAAMLHVLGAPWQSYRKIDIEPLSMVDFRSDGGRWTLRAGSHRTGASARV